MQPTSLCRSPREFLRHTTLGMPSKGAISAIVAAIGTETFAFKAKLNFVAFVERPIELFYNIPLLALPLPHCVLDGARTDTVKEKVAPALVHVGWRINSCAGVLAKLMLPCPHTAVPAYFPLRFRASTVYNLVGRQSQFNRGIDLGRCRRAEGSKYINSEYVYQTRKNTCIRTTRRPQRTATTTSRGPRTVVKRRDR